MRRSLAVLGLLLGALACGPERVRPPEVAPPSARQPSAVIPADLDVALRLDLGKIRTALGASTLSRLRQRASERVAKEPELSRFIADALLRTDTLWVALRPNERPELLDSVTILKGRFKELEPRDYRLEPRFGPAQDLGGGWRLYERSSVRARSDPARLYVRHDELMVLVSTAEIDSVERQLELRAGDEHLEPVAKGVVSFDARPGALASIIEQRSYRLARLLGAARRIRGHADLNAHGLSAELELVLPTAGDASEAGQAMAKITRAVSEASSQTAQLARGLTVEVVNRSIVLRLKLPPRIIAEVLR